jgi:hypothetical protein
MTKFEIGKTYYTRSICDSDMIIKAKIVKRTAKTITTDEGKTFRLVNTYSDDEGFRPWGNYSMAPVITSEKVAA